jgi:P27 family predicted phage terminase small subunit
MNRGRPPKPIEQHRLDGTWRHDEHGKIVTLPLTGAPIKPPDLSPVASELWDHIVQSLGVQDIAKHLDTTTLAEMCRWYARYRRIADEMDKLDILNDANAHYKLMISAGQAWDKAERLMYHFGMTPVARARIKVEPKKNPDAGVMRRKGSA